MILFFILFSVQMLQSVLLISSSFGQWTSKEEEPFTKLSVGDFYKFY